MSGWRPVAFARRHARWLLAAAAVTIAVLGFVALHAVLAEVHLRDVRAALAQVPPGRIAIAVLLTGASYGALTLIDFVALRIVGRPLPWRTAAVASFTSSAFSHTLGLSLLTGGSARYRVYRAAGLELGDVARIVMIASLAFWGGVIALAGAGLLAAGQAPTIGALLLALLAVPPTAYATGRRRLRIGGATLAVPSIRRQLLLLAISTVDLGCALGALAVLVPGLGPAQFAPLIVAYALAIVVALASHVPGGAGIFEATMLATMPGDHAALFAALLLYRLIYYILPLLAAAAGLLAAEAHRLRHPIARGLTLAERAAQTLAPVAVSALIFTGGLILLVSGALPGVHARLERIDAFVPLPVIEGSHLAGSLIGTALLLVAPALVARLRSGFGAARLMLACGIVLSLVKGLDWEEALLLAAILGALQYAKPAFTRDGGIFTEPPDGRWIAAALAAVAMSLWSGFFAYKRVPYDDALWWQFALHGNAPRFLRASFAAGVLLAATACWQLLSAHRPRVSVDTLPAEVAEAAFAQTGRSDANLALTGDKRFLIANARDAFLMYRVQGRSWVVMGDPVGPRAAWDELVWRLRRAAHAARGRLCFFQASEAMLPLFVDLGLQAMKYGDEAHIDLAGFSLDGPRAKSLRHALRRGEAAGSTFAIVPADEVPALLPQLRAISDDWLGQRHGREKRFSLGAFDAAYLARFECAVIRVGNRIVAFANLWRSGDGTELSIDLMRHAADAPQGTMELMVVRMIEWARDRGYAHFNLGMAPLSGLRAGPLAPVWARVGAMLFDNGERLYGFAGLRAFKAKFAPDWVPRFVATPPGLGAARALIDVARLVSG